MTDLKTACTVCPGIYKSINAEDVIAGRKFGRVIWFSALYGANDDKSKEEATGPGIQHGHDFPNLKFRINIWFN
jgi:hypothetical protein